MLTRSEQPINTFRLDAGSARAPSKVGDGAGGKPPFVNLSTVDPEPVEWIWRDRIPAGELTVFDGDSGTNKSSVLVDLAARVSTGRPMPDGTAGVHGGVVFLLGEDSVEKTVVPRLDASGADRSKMVVLPSTITIPDDLDQIRSAINHVDAKLVIIDTLMNFLGTNANGDQAVRQALIPLRELADRKNVGVLLIRHLTKSGGRNPLHRGSGSIGIMATTRSAHLVGRDPKDSGMRVLAHTKSNLGPMAPSLRFEPIASGDGIIHIEWRGESDLKAEDLLSSRDSSDGKLHDAEELLIELLAQGPVGVGLIREAAAARAVSWRTVERAKKSLGVVARHEGFGTGSVWFWKLSVDPT
jgi:RecA-family ATPase